MKDKIRTYLKLLTIGVLGYYCFEALFINPGGAVLPFAALLYVASEVKL